MTRRVAFAFISIAILVSTAVGVALARSSSLSPELQAVRAAVARYHSYNQALADGYSVAGEPCVSSPAGTMGFHAPNPSIIKTGRNDPERPPILLYVHGAGRGLRLVGVEYFQVALVNTPDGPRPWLDQSDPRDSGLTFFTPAPSLFGHRFDGPMAGHNPQMPWHYDLHAWVVEDNPAGVFAQFNRALSC
jgi:hypothetical protein